MFLKIAGELPRYIYSRKNNTLYVNLFIGSEAKIKLDDGQEVTVKQTTNYPWDGHIAINIESATRNKFTVKVRIPGWAQSAENPYDLYRSEVKSKVVLRINGKQTELKINRGYVDIFRNWSMGDMIELNLPIEPRFVYANENAGSLKGLSVVASGPIVYALEELDNPGVNSYIIDINSPVSISYKNDILNGVNIIKGKALVGNGEKVDFTAVPFYTINNRMPGNAFKVWMPVQE
jgi:DUF1680 family protein